MDGFDPSKIPESTSSGSDSAFRPRPASISSYSSILSPHQVNQWIPSRLSRLSKLCRHQLQKLQRLS
jgi:hypothetical protein